MQQPGAVPGSETYLGAEDNDGNQLWVVTAMKEQVVDYVKVLKKSGFPGVQFDYDQKTYLENLSLKQQNEQDLEGLQQKIVNVCYYNFSECFQALLHLKIMRTFIDAVLRYSIPPVFYMGILSPNKGQEKKIWDKMAKAFGEEHLMEMYG